MSTLWLLQGLPSWYLKGYHRGYLLRLGIGGTLGFLRVDEGAVGEVEVRESLCTTSDFFNNSCEVTLKQP